MKKVISIVALLCCIGITGCSTWGNGKLNNPLVATPYQAGRTFVVIDLVTEPVQPQEVSQVIDQVYALAEMNLGVAAADEVVKAQIDRFYPDATPEFRQMLFNVYGILKIRLVDQIESQVDVPEAEVLSEFFRGVKDALALYRPEAPIQ